MRLAINLRHAPAELQEDAVSLAFFDQDGGQSATFDRDGRHTKGCRMVALIDECEPFATRVEELDGAGLQPLAQYRLVAVNRPQSVHAVGGKRQKHPFRQGGFL